MTDNRAEIKRLKSWIKTDRMSAKKQDAMVKTLTKVIKERNKRGYDPAFTAKVRAELLEWESMRNESWKKVAEMEARLKRLEREK